MPSVSPSHHTSAKSSPHHGQPHRDSTLSLASTQSGGHQGSHAHRPSATLSHSSMFLCDLSPPMLWLLLWLLLWLFLFVRWPVCLCVFVSCPSATVSICFSVSLCVIMGRYALHCSVSVLCALDVCSCVCSCLWWLCRQQEGDARGTATEVHAFARRDVHAPQCHGTTAPDTGTWRCSMVVCSRVRLSVEVEQTDR